MNTSYVENLATAIDHLYTEIERAKKKHPGDFINPHHGYAVILEELDELWDTILNDALRLAPEEVRKECIQIAAMAMRYAVELCDLQMGNYEP